MWKFITKKVPTDVLQDWRHIKMGDFHIFDKIIIVSHKYEHSYLEVIGKEGVVIGYCDYGYTIVLKNGAIVSNCVKLKKSYGEFQEEMEALEMSIKKSEEVEELRKKMEKLSNEAIELYKKGKKVVNKNIYNQFGI